MKKTKKILKTIIWTIAAFSIGGIFALPFGNILGLVIHCSFVLITLLLCIRGKLPGTNIKKMIELPRKKAPWYKWQFSFGDVFIFLILISAIYNTIKRQDINIATVLTVLFFLAILFLSLISIWENRLKAKYEVFKLKISK